MARLYADLHCHPTLYGFNRMRNDPRMEEDPELFHPWNEFPSRVDHIADGKRAATYSQCTVPKLARARARLVFASITPIEKGFFVGSADEEGSFLADALRLATGVTAVRTLWRWIRRDRTAALHELAGILRNRGPLRQALQQLFLKYGSRRIKFMLSDEYDYWEEFWREYDFMTARDGELMTVTFEHPGRDGEAVEESVEGRYRMIGDEDDLTETVEWGEDVGFILTVEGAHTFSIGPDQKPVDLDVALERIEELKQLEHPLFFITLAHHFDNGICGHAHSILDAGQLVMDQAPRMHEGFERRDDYGMSIVRALLDLDEDLQSQGGRRILIDVKHMSAQARRQYYREVIEPYNAAWEERTEDERDRHPKIPVIASHAAYAGVSTLDELIANQDSENDHWHVGPFYAWNINLCDEDVRAIHASEGLIGICFDQRICGVKPRENIPADMWPHVIFRQIAGLVDVVMNDDRLSEDDKRAVWDRVCIGSDYDGLIDPVSRYPTVLELDTFADDLAELLEQRKHTRMIADIGVEELVEKICWRNAYDFVQRHLPAGSV